MATSILVALLNLVDPQNMHFSVRRRADKHCLSYASAFALNDVVDPKKKKKKVFCFLYEAICTSSVSTYRACLP
jgi:hypothetical protein